MMRETLIVDGKISFALDRVHSCLQLDTTTLVYTINDAYTRISRKVIARIRFNRQYIKTLLMSRSQTPR